MTGVSVLSVPTPQLGFWRPELALLATALICLAIPAWPRRHPGLLAALGLALATGASVGAIPADPVAPLGPHFVLDGASALARLTIVALALVVVLVLRPRDPRAGGLLALAAAGLSLVAQAATLAGLLVAVAVAAVGAGLAAWLAGDRSGRIAAAQWLAASGLGFGVLAFAGVMACGLAGTLELADLAGALTDRPTLPPLALPLVVSLAGAGLALTLLGDPDRFAPAGLAPTPAALVGWITAAPPLALAALLPRMLAGVVPRGSWLAAGPVMIGVFGTLLVLLGFGIAAAQERLDRRLAWAALGQAGLALLGLAGGGGEEILGTPMLVLLAMAPAQVGAAILAGALDREQATARWREAQLLLLAVLLVSLAALPPLAGWRPRVDLLADLHAAEQTFALTAAAVGTLLGFVVYLWPLATLWRPEPDAVPPSSADAARPSLLPTLLAAALLAGLIGWGLGLVDPVAPLR